MARGVGSGVGKILYASLFCVALPVALISWARSTSSLVPPPPEPAPVAGLALGFTGLLLMMWGIAALWVCGGGLPMNAYPPPRLVTSGIYAVVPHPIYAGFALLTIGVSLATGSAAGWWLVSPTVMLGSAALVLGYERQNLRRRFGDTGAELPAWLPPDDSRAPALRDRLAFCAMVLLPWVAIFQGIQLLGIQPGSIDPQLRFEMRLPVVGWTAYLYASTYFAVAAAPFLVTTRGHLRELWLRALLSMAIVFPLHLLLPSLAPRRPFVSTTWGGAIIVWERGNNMPVAAFPSFHVVWSILAAEAIASRAPKLAWILRGWAAAVAIACLTTGMHSLADVAAGAGIGVVIIHRERVWEWLRRFAELTANSWKEWRLGPIRLINHGFYAGAATVVAYSVVGAVVGPGRAGLVAFNAVSALLGAALWAQWIEGSPRLLRPYGFYGGVAGAIAASLLTAALFPVDAWLLLAANCVAAPWLQSIGRARCLVQGCCHGAPTSPAVGIRYLHPRSRVTQIAALAGVPLHPTPLYSMLWNIPVGLLLARLWSVGAALHLIGGVYLILSGVGRFVEEAYRGEPQTPIYAGLRLYQWVAIVTIVAGAAITALGDSGPAPPPQFTWTGTLNALVLGAIATAALGVDFPSLNRRFARLS